MSIATAWLLGSGLPVTAAEAACLTDEVIMHTAGIVVKCIHDYSLINFTSHMTPTVKFVDTPAMGIRMPFQSGGGPFAAPEDPAAVNDGDQSGGGDRNHRRHIGQREWSERPQTSLRKAGESH